MSFYGLDISEEEALKNFNDIKEANNRDGRICICGHSMGYHSDPRETFYGGSSCSAQKQSCPCKKSRPVLKTNGSKGFLYKTQGGAGLHALTQGIVRAMKDNKTVEWIEEPKCDRCGKGDVVPCPVTQNGVIADKATGFDVFLCKDCRVSL